MAGGRVRWGVGASVCQDGHQLTRFVTRHRGVVAGRLIGRLSGGGGGGGGGGGSSRGWFGCDSRGCGLVGCGAMEVWLGAERVGID